MIASTPAGPVERVFRFAPSPNGYLHLGHAFSALLNQEMARAAGGRLLLRLEDIDRERCREAYAAAIVEDLGWLGVAWHAQVPRQSARFPVYAGALRRLEERGLAYPCFCTRGTIAAALEGRPDWPADPDGVPLYPGTCKALAVPERARRLAEGWPAVRRLDTRRALEAVSGPLGWAEIAPGAAPRWVEAAPDRWGDPMIARKDVPASYHLSVVLDDAHQGVTDIVRGADLLPATGLHRLLQRLLGLPEPRYHHHGLLLDAAGRKLSKSRQAPSLRAMRQDGATPEEVRRRLGFA